MLNDSLYLAQGVDSLPLFAFRIFKPDPVIEYLPLCDDFGPMNMACVTRFITQLQNELVDFPDDRHFYCVEDGKRSLTNAVFLLGCYQLLILDQSVDEISDCFSWMKPEHFEEYRDATFAVPTFRLTLVDCWRALDKAKMLGWVGMPDPDGFCGTLDIREYAHYDQPYEGDLHEVVPGKLIAFVGPTDIGEELYLDDAGYRRFSPAFFAGIFEEFGVSAVVRLNEAQYDGRAFADQGMALIDLPFDDCTPPPPPVAEAFLAAVDGAKGLVAVHCKAGLGRTGTLIALYLMRSEGFTAREAMGWLRIMRPGSVIGEQQQYLCDMEPGAGRGSGESEPFLESDAVENGSGAGGPGRNCGAEGIVTPAGLAEEVWAGALRRGAARGRDSVVGHIRRPGGDDSEGRR